MLLCGDAYPKGLSIQPQAVTQRALAFFFNGMLVVVKGGHRIRSIPLSLPRRRLWLYFSKRSFLYVVVVGFEDLWLAGAEVGGPGRERGGGLRACGMAGTWRGLLLRPGGCGVPSPDLGAPLLTE